MFWPTFRGASLAGFAIDSVYATEGGIRLRASPLSTSAQCLTCAVSSKRVDSRYGRMRAPCRCDNLKPAQSPHPASPTHNLRKHRLQQGDVFRTDRWPDQSMRTVHAVAARNLEKVALALVGRAAVSAELLSPCDSTCCLLRGHVWPMDWSPIDISPRGEREAANSAGSRVSGLISGEPDS